MVGAQIMSLSDREKMEITDIVLRVLDARLSQMTKEIIAGFVECVDWNNENFAKIMEAMNSETMAELTKRKREVIEIRDHTQQQEQEEAKRKSERLGFKKAANG